MKLIGILLVILLGLSLLQVFARKLTWLGKLTLAFPIGMGVLTFIMFLMDLAGLPLNKAPWLFSISLVIIILSHAWLAWKHLLPAIDLKKAIPDLKTMVPNFAWLYIAGFSVYALYVLFAKTVFWPVTAYDSVAGFDFIARITALEGTLNNSLFNPDYPLFSNRSVYPPLPPLSFAYAFILGFESSKIIIALFTLSFFLAFYSILKYHTTHLGAVLFTFFLIITPELAAFSALSSSNPIATLYCALGLIYIYTWYISGTRDYLYVGSALLLLGLCSRTEAIVFVAAGGLMMLVKSVKTKKFLPPVVFAALALAVYGIWQYYLNNVIQLEQGKWIITHLFWDPDKLGHMLSRMSDVTFNTQYYGILVYAFIIVVLANALNIIKGDRVMLLVSIAASYILFLIVYYHIDADYSTDAGVWISAGYKRGMFYFLPLLVFYMAVNKYAVLIFNKYLKLG